MLCFRPSLCKAPSTATATATQQQAALLFFPMSSKSTENTVFVRFTPPKSEITRFHVEQIFSDIGPIKKCSIIRSHPQNVGLGYGFCKFVSNRDAETAARDYQDKVVEIEGQTFTLTVELASQQATGKRKEEYK